MQHTLATIVVFVDLVLLQIPDLPPHIETPVTVLAALAAVRVLWAGWQKKDQRGDDQSTAIVNKMLQMQERNMEVLAALCKDLAGVMAKNSELIETIVNQKDPKDAQNNH
jgi:hypothetical protein